MAEKQVRVQEQQYREAQKEKQQKAGQQKDGKEALPEAFHQLMNKEQQEQMTQLHQMQTLWLYWLLIILGVWLVMSPLTFSYGKGLVTPSGGREVWISMADRSGES